MTDRSHRHVYRGLAWLLPKLQRPYWVWLIPPQPAPEQPEPDDDTPRQQMRRRVERVRYRQSISRTIAE